MIKKLIAAAVIFAAGLAAAQAARIPVLTYHRISADTTMPSAEDVRITRFEEHLKMLRDDGYTSFTVSELAAMMSSGQTLPARSVVLTFDDGWRSHIAAQRLLAKYGMKGTFYIVSGLLDTRGYMTKDELRQLAAQPNVEIGGHTHTHFLKWMNSLDSLPTSTIVEEMTLSKGLIEGIVGKPVTAFAWPFGYVRKEVQKLAPSMGYTSLAEVNEFTTNDNDISPLKMERVNVEGRCTAAQIKFMVDTGRLDKCK